MTDACWLHLRNGWTVSIAAPFAGAPGICSIAAWPSKYDDSGNASDETGWFHFSDGAMDRKCYSLLCIKEALNEIEAAAPPEV